MSKQTNNASIILNNEIPYWILETEIVLPAWAGELFWDEFPYKLTYEFSDIEKNIIEREIIRVTNRNTDTLTIQRAVEKCPISDSTFIQTQNPVEIKKGWILEGRLTAEEIIKLENNSNYITNIENWILETETDLEIQNQTWTLQKINVQEIIRQGNTENTANGVVIVWNDWKIDWNLLLATPTDQIQIKRPAWENNIAPWDLIRLWITYILINLFNIYQNTNNNVFATWITNSQKVGQTFTTGATLTNWFEYILTSISPKIYKQWNPTDNWTVKLYDSAGWTLIANSTTSRAGSTISTTPSFVNFNFDNIILQPNTQYFFEFSRSWSINNSNYIWVRFYSWNALNSASMWNLPVNLIWDNINVWAWDMAFYVYIGKIKIQDNSKVFKLISWEKSLWFADNSWNLDDEISINIWWIDKNQSWLIIDENYYPSTTAWLISTTTSGNTIWRAISSTELLINTGWF